MAQHPIISNEKRVPQPKVKSGESAGASGGQDIAMNQNRRSMIATAAYYHAEQRGFNGVSEMQDWLEAEAEIDAPEKKH
ncbi:MAG: DUF2934 domain-containing protein [Gallionella sp.]